MKTLFVCSRHTSVTNVTMETFTKIFGGLVILLQFQMSTATSVEVSCIKRIVTYPSCPDGWETFESSCYYFGDVSLDYSVARTTCLAADAHLVIVNTVAELNYLKTYMLDRILQPEYGYWNDAFQPGDNNDYMVWRTTNETLVVTDWHAPSNQPKNHGQLQRCGAFWEDFGYEQADIECYVPEYNDGNNGRKSFTLCEKERLT